MLVPSPLKTVLKSASLSDIPEITSLAEKIWRAHYPAIIGQQQVDYMLGAMYSPEAVAADMQKGQRYHFIEDDGMRVGYIGWSKPAEHELFIHKFYIDQQVQGKGVGKRAFAALLALHPDVQHVRLTVNRKNYKSINFYFRIGFVIEKVADFDIGNGYFMNDFVMRRDRS